MLDDHSSVNDMLLGLYPEMNDMGDRVIGMIRDAQENEQCELSTEELNHFQEQVHTELQALGAERKRIEGLLNHLGDHIHANLNWANSGEWSNHSEIMHALDQKRHHIRNIETIAERVAMSLSGHLSYPMIQRKAHDSRNLVKRMKSKIDDVRLKLGRE